MNPKRGLRPQALWRLVVLAPFAIVVALSIRAVRRSSLNGLYGG